jgi:hypothetical protein
MPATILCPSCQKEYPWKPDLAGKRVKCTCGEVIDVPTVAPKAEVDELYDLADDPSPKAQHGVADLQSVATAAAVAVDDSRQFPCPYCGEKLNPGSMMCVFCGSNLEGAIPETAQRTVPTAMQAAPPVATRPVIIPHNQEEAKSNRLKLIILGLTVLVPVAAIIVITMLRSMKVPPPTAYVKPADAPILAKVNGGSAVEARDWLKDDNHALSGMNHRQSVFRVDQLYDLGDKRVMVFGGGQSLGLELPSEAAKRKAVFDWQKKWNTENNFKIVADEGQKWLEIQMHL